MAQIRGVVKWFNAAKGFGFIGHDGGPDVFVHYSAIQANGFRNLTENDEVHFEIVVGTKGPQADQDRVLGKPDHSSEGQPVQLVAPLLR